MSRLPRRSRKKAAEVNPTRIGQLLRLALSSNQAGEITAAVGALRRAMCAAGMDLHQLADAAERGLRPPAATAVASAGRWGPPAPESDDWLSMSWYLFHHKHSLRPHQREFIEDLLLGRGEGFEDGQICRWAVQELREMVAAIGTRP